MRRAPAARAAAGIITGGDLLNRADLELRLRIERELDADALHALRLSRKRARDVMTRHVHTIEDDADLASSCASCGARARSRPPGASRARDGR